MEVTDVRKLTVLNFNAIQAIKYLVKSKTADCRSY